ncbi:hypothetical protein [Streptomyces sp. SID3212]|uniref:hypothetical protein n=1 Tax=Streptomyces sp. SID3212 TaxID=2690259 RepID=UPI0013701133|nr:hypothetical protein [Streptomyces sp. SID3212]MYV51052.1 hypothetical protein [Streptomyces sp. SID3212]
MTRGDTTMPWDELKQALTAQKAAYTPGDPLWTVEGTNGWSFRAHPAFLDEVRLGNGLPDLVTATDGRTFGAALGRWRVTLDSHLKEIPEVRAALGLAAGRFPSVDEEITLLRHRDSVRALRVGSAPVIAAAGTAFADRIGVKTVHDYVELHSFFLTAVNGFGGAYDPNTHPGRVDALYALAAGSPAAAGAGTAHLGGEADWKTHQPGFALAVHAEAARINFRTPNALAGHAFKHVPRGGPLVPAAAADVHALLADYLAEARQKIITTATNDVWSGLAQTGATRTYYFGTVNQHACMVAVNSAGHAWISTYYAPNRT